MARYVLSVICAALISGVALSLAQSSAAKGVVKLLCGAFLAVTVVSPLTRMDLESLLDLPFPDRDDVETMTAAGERMARKSLEESIVARCAAYIQDKAAACGAEVSVEIGVSGDPIPVPGEAVITGNLSPAAREKLKTMIHSDLGIPEESIRWTG